MSELRLSNYGLMTVAEAAARLGRSVRGVQKLVGTGRLRAITLKVGPWGMHLIPRDEVEGFVPEVVNRRTRPGCRR